LHDLLADRGQLRPLATALAPSGSRVILPDARGHGASPTISGRGYPTAELVEDALAVLDAEVVTTAIVVAAGWSAAAALRLALRAPDRIAALFLTEPYLPASLAEFADGEPHDAGFASRQALETAANFGDRGQLDRALDLVIGARFGEDWRARLPRSAQAAARRNAVNLAPLLAGFLADPLAPGDLAGIEAPVTILLPDGAMPVIRQTGAWLAVALPHTQTERFQQLGEAPDERALWLGSLVRAVPASPS
jgi:pimeloyl-ACP methyl ester carboxylesterase